MKPQRSSIRSTVRVPEYHRGAEQRGMVGRIADRCGGEGCTGSRPIGPPPTSPAIPSSYSADLGPTRPAQPPGVVVACYERFVRLPVAVVLALMWLVGAALLGSSALVLYALAASIASVVAGA